MQSLVQHHIMCMYKCTHTTYTSYMSIEYHIHIKIHKHSVVPKDLNLLNIYIPHHYKEENLNSVYHILQRANTIIYIHKTAQSLFLRYMNNT